MKKDIVIKVEGLSKRYSIGKREKYLTLRDRLVELPKTFLRKSSKKQDFWALKDVSFEVKRGEVLGIIGRNGAGKSTLLKILSRITEPTSGKITMKGRVASMLEVGTGFNPELTGRENIYLNGAILGMTKAEIKTKFDQIVEFSGVGKFLDTPVKRYSSGMYVRLAFAVAAHLDSDILIVDEVLAVGDAEFQKKCLGKMNSLAKSGKTVIFVSHNMTAIQSMCSQTILLESGGLKSYSDSRDTISLYFKHDKNNKYQTSWNDKKSPRNNSIKLKKVKLTMNNQLTKKISTDNTFDIEISYQTLKKLVYGGITISIYNQQGVHVLSSINNHEEWHNKPLPKTSLVSICSIPKHLLNTGEYAIDINLFGRGYTDLVVVKNVISFQIVDGDQVRGDYLGKFGGLIRPMFKWVTTKEK